MLDEKDLQAISQILSAQKTEIMSETKSLLSAQKTEIMSETKSLLSAQKTEIMGETKSLLSAQKKEMMGEVHVLMESEFGPKFDLLAEGQQTILDKLVPRSRVDDLEDEVKFLKSIVRRMDDELQSMKKAN